MEQRHRIPTCVHRYMQVNTYRRQAWTSQRFAIYYLDGFDRLIKEKLRIKYYSRYMDDCVLINPDKQYLQHCLTQMRNYLKENLELSFNDKTQIFPLINGMNYLGWHIYLTDRGKVIRKVKQQTKRKYRRKLKYFMHAYAQGKITLDNIKPTLKGYAAYLCT